MNPWYIVSVVVIYALMWWMTAVKFARAEYRRVMARPWALKSTYEDRLRARRSALIYGVIIAIPWPLMLPIRTLQEDFRSRDLMGVIPPDQTEMNMLNREREARINGLERQIWKRPRQ